MAGAIILAALLSPAVSPPPSPPPFPPGPPAPPPPPLPLSPGLTGDPHLHFADGGEADFRGEDGAVYNMLSHTNISVNGAWEMASFLLPLHWGGMKVRGSFVTDAYVVIKAASSGRTIRIEYSPNQPPTPLVHGLPGATAAKRLLAGEPGIAFEDVSASLEARKGGQGGGAEVLQVSTAGWKLEASARLIWRSTVPGKKQIDLSFAPLRDPLAPQLGTGKIVAPHGLIGQSYDGDGMAVDGKQDKYTDLWKAQGGGHEIATEAQAEGAIEGMGADYKMADFFGTDFKYSRFAVAEAPVRDVSKLAGTHRLIRLSGDAGVGTPSWRVSAGTIGDDERGEDHDDDDDIWRHLAPPEDTEEDHAEAD